MLGLVGAGKRTILYKLRLTENKKPISTIGFNVETLEYKDNIYSCNYSNIRRIKKLKHQGAKIFNSLPIKTRETQDRNIFKTLHTGSFHKYHDDGLQQAVFIKKNG